MGCVEASLPQAAALAARFGFQGVELRGLLGRVDLPEALKQEYQTPERFSEAVGRLPVPVVALDSSFRLLGGSEAHRQETITLARWADAIGVPYVRVFDGGEHGQGHDPEARCRIGRELDWWDALREQEAIKCHLMIESHWALTDAEDILRMADERGGKFDLLWDVVHTWNHSGKSFLEDWPRLKPYARHLHVKDGRRDPAAKDGVHHSLPGEGELPFPEFFQMLKEDHFSGPVSLEWERYWEPAMEPLEFALERGRAAGWW